MMIVIIYFRVECNQNFKNLVRFSFSEEKETSDNG
jgi:hypothetical protein